MLAGVSHDLRTPLTRMKLQLSLLKDIDAKELEIDIQEMTAMLDSYVSFVKTEFPETIEYIVINDVIKECLKNIDTQNYIIKFDEINRVQTSGPIQLKRAFQNITIQRDMQIKLILRFI